MQAYRSVFSIVPVEKFDLSRPVSPNSILCEYSVRIAFWVIDSLANVSKSKMNSDGSVQNEAMT
jgi:hypothetical protein